MALAGGALVPGSREGLKIRIESGRKLGMRRMLSGMGKKLPFFKVLGHSEVFGDRSHARANSVT